MVIRVIMMINVIITVMIIGSNVLGALWHELKK